jgi:hypothetical protein
MGLSKTIGGRFKRPLFYFLPSTLTASPGITDIGPTQP